jgi:hypothetical protein
MDGGAASPHEARLIGKKIRAAALAEGLRARMSYAEPGEHGYTCWYASIVTQEEDGQ